MEMDSADCVTEIIFSFFSIGFMINESHYLRLKYESFNTLTQGTSGTIRIYGGHNNTVTMEPLPPEHSNTEAH